MCWARNCPHRTDTPYGGTRRPNSARATEAAQNGAASVASENFEVRTIGILPKGDARIYPDIQGNVHTLVVQSGISHKQRDATNGATVDVLIALKGSTGTLTEVAFAHALGKPVVLLDSRTHLQGRLVAHGRRPEAGSGTIGKSTKQPKSLYSWLVSHIGKQHEGIKLSSDTTGDGALSEYIKQALLIYPKLTSPIGKADIENGLGACLEMSKEFTESASVKAVRFAIELANARGIVETTGFPGIPPDLSGSKSTFETMLTAL